MSLVYLDSVIPIYILDGIDPFRTRAEVHYRAIMAAGDATALSELTKLECRIGPLRSGSAVGLAAFELFFASQTLVPLTVAVYERAAHIRASYRFNLADAIHLAAAVEGRCDRYLTNDTDLARFRDVAVEILP